MEPLTRISGRHAGDLPKCLQKRPEMSQARSARGGSSSFSQGSSPTFTPESHPAPEGSVGVMGKTLPGWCDSTSVSAPGDLGDSRFGWNLSFIHELNCLRRCQWEVLAGSQRPGGSVVTAWEFNPELTFEQAGSDWIVLDADAGVVLRASGPAAHVLTALAAPGTAPHPCRTTPTARCRPAVSTPR